MLGANGNGFFPYTPATNLLYGLSEAADMLFEEGLDNVFARHDRFAEATRRAVRAWGLEILCQDEREYSSVLTAVKLPDGHDADAFRKVVLENFDMSLGNGLGKVAGKVFRIGHLGQLSDALALSGIATAEMVMADLGLSIRLGSGVAAAQEVYRHGNLTRTKEAA
jgi:alanine-glyoxylate transaminase/serine-glyoxylate transaminase/serine-pyruvate transaminase